MTPKQFHDLVMAFPETELGESYGQPAYKAFGKFFTRLRTEDDSVVIGQIPLDEREMLCEADPQTFHVTDHYRNYPTILARLKRLDARALKGYLSRQWRYNAPKTWLKAWEAGTPLPVVSKKKAVKPKRGSGAGRTRR
jgi:hypothetical protein